MIENEKYNIIQWAKSVISDKYLFLFKHKIDKYLIDLIETVHRDNFCDAYYNDELTAVTRTESWSVSSLQRIYEDRYLPIQVSGGITSSISQPSLVLYMLHLLRLRSTAAVLEIGTASGWNAALLQALVGHEGVVDTIEIDSALAETARKRLSHLHNVQVIEVDCARFRPTRAYDAIEYTVGAYRPDFHILQSLRRGGRLAFVQKFCHGGDVLYTFVRQDEFILESSRRCSFVEILGDQAPTRAKVDMCSSELVRIELSQDGPNKLASFAGFLEWAELTRRYSLSHAGSITNRRVELTISGERFVIDTEGVYSPNAASGLVLTIALDEWNQAGSPTAETLPLRIQLDMNMSICAITSKDE